MTNERLEQIFRNLDNARIAILGDFCLDVYWYADMRRSTLSRETPHHPLPIVRERMSPSGAGNVAASVTVKKLGTTGTADRDELCELH